MQREKNKIKIIIPTYTTIEFVAAEDIICFEADDNYCKILMVNGEWLTSTQGLGRFAAELYDRGFCHCHKSHMVNIHKAIRYHKDSKIELEGGRVVPVARRRKEEVMGCIKHNFRMNFYGHPKCGPMTFLFIIFLLQPCPYYYFTRNTFKNLA